MIYLSVDSIEDGYATCEDDNRDKWEINIKKLPNGIKEGDVVLIKDDRKFLIDDKEKKIRQNAAISLLEKVLHSKDEK